MQSNLKKRVKEDISYKKLFLFFLPLVVTPAIISGLAYTLGEGAEAFAVWFQAYSGWKKEKGEIIYED
ncbi:MAG: hypothetical protein ABR596_10930 [Halarsenatibacteraceae bacterium]